VVIITGLSNIKEVSMDEREKLKKLLPHWKEHNDEHAESYRKWSEKTASIGHWRLSEILKKLSEESRKLNGLFEEAMQTIDQE
jgi:hypothetical protein